MTVQQCAKRLGVSRTTVYKLLNNRELGYIQVLGKKVIPDESLAAYLQANTFQPQPVKHVSRDWSNLKSQLLGIKKPA